MNITPKDDDSFTDEQFYALPGSYKEFLAKIYGGLAVTGQVGPAGDSDFGSSSGIDEGFSQYLRGYWQLQELTTDEAIIAWGESDNPTIKDLNFNTWDADNKFVYPFFARVFYQIGLCNEFLRQTTDSKLDSRGVDSNLRAQIKTYRAEVRFLFDPAHPRHPPVGKREREREKRRERQREERERKSVLPPATDGLTAAHCPASGHP